MALIFGVLAFRQVGIYGVGFCACVCMCEREKDFLIVIDFKERESFPSIKLQLKVHTGRGVSRRYI